MTTTEKPYEFGLYVSRHRESFDRNSIRVTVSVVMRSDEGDWPCGVNDTRTSSWDKRCPKRLRGLNLQDLGMAGHVYESRDNGNEWIGYDPDYRQVYSIDLRKAESHLKTLKALERAKERWRKVHGYGIPPADMLAIFAKFVGAKFVVFRDDVANPSKAWSFKDNGPWTFLGVDLGVEKYGQWIEEQCKAHVPQFRRETA
jgi:hypothetical protein